MVIDYLPNNGLTTFVLVSTMLTVLPIFVRASPDWTDCPPPCLCKWTYGKKSALCASSNLTSIPSLNSELQVLDLQNNHITYLRKDEFSVAGLINLQRIFLKNSSLREIHRDAFRDLKILIEVDLSYNQISVIPRNTFAGNDRLKVLILSYNPLRQLFNEQFPNLPHLRSLELDNCQIHAVGRDAFVHLDQLEKLNLRHNDLENLSESVFMPIVNLKSLLLDENPWKCDCTLRPFRNWYLSSKLHSISLICAEPKRLKDKLWEEITSIDFACPPDLRIDETIYRIQTGDNVTFSCQVKGDPEPEANWLFKGYPVGTPNATHIDQILILEVEEGLVNKWVNMSLFNVTQNDSGEYTCIARNFLGSVNKNVSLYIQQVVTIPVILGKADSPIPVVSLVGGSVFSVAISVVLTTCLCLLCGYQKRKRRHRRKGRIKESGSFTEQDKRLLDCSITTSTERQSGTHSMEMFGSCHGDFKMHESTSTMTMELCEPVQIKLDRRTHDVGTMIPMTTSYPSSFGVYAPHMDYNNTRLIQSGTYGNIFISVQVGKDHHYIDADKYPDLLEVPCNKTKTDSIVTTCDESTYCSIPISNYATLPRRQLRTIAESHQQPPQMPVYDSLGKRVTMQGSSTLSLPDAQHNEVVVEVLKEPPITLEVDEYVSL